MRIKLLTFLLAILVVSGAYGNDSPAQNTWQMSTATDTAQILGWIKEPKRYPLCGGSYHENPIIAPVNMREHDITIDADHTTLDLNHGKPSELRGHVVVTQIDHQLHSQRALSFPDKNSSNPQTVKFFGDIRLLAPGMFVTGNKAVLNVPEKLASIDDTLFRYQATPLEREQVYNSQHQLQEITISGVNYRGTAKKINEVAPKIVDFTDVIFTSCNPYSHAWSMKAEALTLNQNTGFGTTYNTMLYLDDVPVFYTPYFRFPIDSRRRSGFLSPIINYSTNSGSTFGMPYYWNLAPNYDLLMTPEYYTLRGLQLRNLFRYLDWHGTGQIYFSYLPNDAEFSAFKDEAMSPGDYPNASPDQKTKLKNTSTNRYQFAWIDSSRFNQNISTDVNIDYVNDDNYLQDFGDAPFVTSDIYNSLLPATQVIQTADIVYATPHWNTTAQVTNVQTLHPVNLALSSDQYSRLPEIDVNGNYPNSWLTLDYQVQNQLVDFQHPLFENMPVVGLSNTVGYRYNLLPSINLYRGKSWGYINPKVAFDETLYNVQSPDTTADQQTSMSRGVPIYDFDSGLYFDRDIELNHNAYTQTFEPRLFYLYVPYVNQGRYPLFDASLSPALSYDQLFATNRFNGFDRISDANQVSVGVTSRFVQNSSGLDVFNLSLGQIYYFRDREVQLSQIGGSDVPPGLTDTTRVSPIVGQATWQFRRDWNAVGNFAYDGVNHWLQNSNISINYNRDNSHVFTTGYSFVKGGETTTTEPNVDLQQASIGTVWSVNHNWQVLTGMNYNVSHHYPQTYLYGVEYDSCCWAIRLIDSEQYIGLQTNSTAPLYDNQVSLQFLLRGLAASGWGAPSSLLQYVIPGYNDTFGQQNYLANS